MSRRILAAVLLFCASGWAAAPLAPNVPDAAKASAHFDVKAATDAWLASIPPAAQAKSNAYFEGGYWLILWDFLYTAGVMLLLLETGLSARLRGMAQRVTSRRWLHFWVYFILFDLAAFVLYFPITVYEGYFREHQYGLSNLSFAGWFKEQLIGLAISALIGGSAFMALFAVVRRLRANWHVWGAGIAFVFLCLGIVIGPVFIAPLFNQYKPLENLAMKERILSLARASGIPATDVYEMDASKQTKRVSANVSGFMGTERITLNDNLLARCSPAAVMSTMGHEMGHYVLHHIYNAVIFFAVVISVMFWLLRRGLDWLLAKRGKHWKVEGVFDMAVLPAAILVFSALGFAATPLLNSFTRQQEYEADLYGLNAAREPDGEAEVDLLLGEYRKMDPTPLEETIFFDHPSGRTRITAAMRWKAENLQLFPSGQTDPPSAPHR